MDSRMYSMRRSRMRSSTSIQTQFAFPELFHFRQAQKKDIALAFQPAPGHHVGFHLKDFFSNRIKTHDVIETGVFPLAGEILGSFGGIFDQTVPPPERLFQGRFFQAASYFRFQLPADLIDLTLVFFWIGFDEQVVADHAQDR